MSDAGKPELSTLWANPIFNFEMAGLHTHAYSKTINRENTGFADLRFAGTVELR
jgi:hypothetical protein